MDELEYTGNVEDETKFGITLGRVKFGLEYDFDDEALSVTIFEAKDLPAADEGTYNYNGKDFDLNICNHKLLKLVHAHNFHHYDCEMLFPCNN